MFPGSSLQTDGATSQHQAASSKPEALSSERSHSPHTPMAVSHFSRHDETKEGSQVGQMRLALMRPSLLPSYLDPSHKILIQSATQDDYL